MSMCSVSVEALTALATHLPAHISDAGRQPEEMGTARDEQPQPSTAPNR